MTGRATVTFYNEPPVTGHVQLDGPWVHVLRDAEVHELQEKMPTKTYNTATVYAIHWTLDSGPFAHSWLDGDAQNA